MSYQVIARKWRPQKFDDVVGQQAVTRTLRNALASGRLAQAFVFAGPRGVGKTTTARILARAFNCVHGPTPDPCGECDACVEITEGRDIDVLEIDAATHTGIDNVREVIISGLSILPVRDQYKVFIIDEVHQLSGASFNALLKSIEEPPPHVVFLMATTELEKIPETVRSRLQIYEFRTIATSAIVKQLRHIVDAEGIEVGDESLQLIARDADGSMRDAQSKLDQVIAFTGATVGVDDVSTVLGLVGRDLLLDIAQAVADEDAAAAFRLAGRAVEMGYDLRLVCRELSRVVRDLLVLSVDPSRISDPEIAGEGDRERLQALGGAFSREDLLRAFDVLTRAEFDIRSAAEPRYHLEMMLLRWIYLRKLVSIDDLISGAGVSAAGRPAPRATGQTAPKVQSSPLTAKVPPRAERPVRNAKSDEPTRAASGRTELPGGGELPAGTALKDALLAEIRKSKVVFYNTIVVQALKVVTTTDTVTFSFSPAHRALRDTFEQNRPWIEKLAEKAAGRRIKVLSERDEAPAAPAVADADSNREASDRKTALKEEALADEGVQALLDVFPAEIRDVEEV